MKGLQKLGTNDKGLLFSNLDGGKSAASPMLVLTFPCFHQWQK